MTTPAFSPPLPISASPLPSLYPCPHLPCKTKLTIRGCEANREFVRAILGGEKIRVNNHPVFKDKEMALGLKHVCRDCPGIMEVNGMKTTESPAVRKALQAEARPSGKRGRPPKSSTLGSATVPVSPIPPVPDSPPAAAPPPPLSVSPHPPVPPSPPPSLQDPVLNIRRCKNHPDRPWHKNTGLCLECNHARLKTSANGPTAKLPHERKKNQILLDFEGRDDLLQWLQTEAADQLRTPEAQLMFMVKTQCEAENPGAAFAKRRARLRPESA